MLKPTYTHRPKTLTVIAACIALGLTRVTLARNAIPKVNVNDVKQRANHYSTLPEATTDLLVAAIQTGDIQVIEMMINNGIDINTPLASDGTALIIAVMNNDRVLVDALIDMGADVNQSALGDGNPLIAAAMTNNLPLANYLLDLGAEIDAVVEGDETALMNASHHGHYNIFGVIAPVLMAKNHNEHIMVVLQIKLPLHFYYSCLNMKLLSPTP